MVVRVSRCSVLSHCQRSRKRVGSVVDYRGKKRLTQKGRVTLKSGKNLAFLTSTNTGIPFSKFPSLFTILCSEQLTGRREEEIVKQKDNKRGRGGMD